jgi:hypothetical protein
MGVAMIFTSDRKTSGAKLAWLVCMFVFVPFLALTAIVDNPRRKNVQDKPDVSTPEA